MNSPASDGAYLMYVVFIDILTCDKAIETQAFLITDALNSCLRVSLNIVVYIYHSK